MPDTCDDSERYAEPEPPIRTEAHALVLLPGMEPMLRSIERAVDTATRRVMVECYIYADDALGRSFGERLAAAAARGVPTRLLFDPLGSQKTGRSFFDDLRARGVDVRAYRPRIVGANPFPRDHGRVMVVDDCAWTGGAAWAEQWLPRTRGGHGWHDVCCHAQGPVVSDFAALFDQRWREAHGAEPKDFDTRDRHRDVRLISDTPHRESLVYEHHRDAFRAAKRRIWIENAYFFPPPGMLADLYAAAARGVDVRVTMPGETDLPIMQRAARAEYAQWIDHGLVLHEMQGCVLHSKFAVVDDDWCSIGTFNANPTSVALANEVNLFVCDRTFVARVAALFEANLARCKRVGRDEVAARPLVDRIKDRLANDALDALDVIVGPERRDSVVP